jgi:2-(3-amino-3-carboxypropyl)histidine synthase
VSINDAIKQLPANYNFEIHKSIWRIKQEASKVVALQFPEGLLLYACIIADIFQKYCNVDILILGDVTYGACCVDDYTSKKLGADLLIHYGHSCLVPVSMTSIKVMYVFVEIYFDNSHLINTLQRNFDKESRLALMGTIQFTSTLHNARSLLTDHFPTVFIPQAKPLSAGETLGCTSPILPDCDALIFIADGRFHLEAAMIRNPNIPAYRYDPYTKILSREGYDVEKMKSVRLASIRQAAHAKVFGLILGTLGRQGSIDIFKRLKALIENRQGVVISFLMAEVNPVKLSKISEVDVWVQVACPRLSIDWGGGFSKPILTPYELEVALDETKWQAVYPMDYYANELSSWSNLTYRK